MINKTSLLFQFKKIPLVWIIIFTILHPSIFFLRDIKPDVRCIFFSNGIKNSFDPFDIVSRIRSTILLTRSSFVDERVTTAIDSSLVLCLYTVIYGICLYTIVRSTNSKIEIYKRIKVIIITSGEFTFSR